MLRRFVTPEEAMGIIQEHFTAAPIGTEVVFASKAYGRVLAEDVTSTVNVPPFDRSKVDGYAIKSGDTFAADERKPVKLKLLGHVSAGEVPRWKVTQGSTVEIATGAPLPRGADAVVMIEHSHQEGDIVNIYHSVAPGENILRRGFDIKAGEIVLKKFQRITAREIGVLAAIGLTKVKVFKQPKIAVISTGNELVEPGKPLHPARVYDINRSTIAMSVSECGCKPVVFGIVKDDPKEIKGALKKALTIADGVVTSGATSAGVEDILPKLLNELGKPGVIVGGLSTKPGKPTAIAIVNRKPIFALPGHPTSAFTIFNLLARPLLRKMAGLPAETREFIVEAYTATRIFSAKGKRTYVTVRLERTASGQLLAHPIPVESGAITTLAKADGFVEIREGREFIEKGEKVRVHLLSLRSEY